MRVGILTSAQSSETPYSKCERYVSKKAVKALLGKTHVRVEGRRDVIQERPVRSATAGRVVIVRMPIKTIVERQYSRPTHPAPVKCDIQPSPNESLDLCYPEAMRVTVHHVHPGLYRGER